MTCKHGVWFEIESDVLGIPIKYKCRDCGLIYKIKINLKDVENWKKEYFDTINSLSNRIAENRQRIELIQLTPLSVNEKIHIQHLQKENVQLYKILNQYKVI